MKKFALLFLLSPFVVTAQQTTGESVISAGVGYSLIGALFSVSSDLAETESFATPAIHFGYDYGLTDNMSLGLAVGYQKMGIRYTDYEYFNSDDELVTEDFEWSLSRLNIGARALFHYGNNDKFDMYSGARFGFQSFNSKSDSSDPNFDATDFKGGAFGVQLVAFGARGYFTEALGFNFELAIGSPYLVMGGLCYRLGGN
jgi:opacity protein-like surface antigen